MMKQPCKSCFEKFSPLTTKRIVQALIKWHSKQGRKDLKWLRDYHVASNPYSVWVSEVILQQTTLATGKKRIGEFLSRFPSLEILARSSLEEILQAFAGLGYYARGRNLHTCAQVVMEKHGGHFPSTIEALCALPGIGRYTAGALMTFCYNQNAPVLECNIARVIARLFYIATPFPAGEKVCWEAAASLLPVSHPRIYTQALLDLGSTLCTPLAPNCPLCPLQSLCRYATNSTTTNTTRPLPPIFPPKPPRPTRRTTALWVTTNIKGQHCVLLQKRENKGLLGGMMEFPSTPWQENTPLPKRPNPSFEKALSFATPSSPSWTLQDQVIHHTFTHFYLHLKVALTHFSRPPMLKAHQRFCPVDSLHNQALPTVMKKVATLAMLETKTKT